MLRYFFLLCLALLPLFIKAQTTDSINIDWLVQQPDSVVRMELKKQTKEVEKLYSQSRYQRAADILKMQLELVSKTVGKNDSSYINILNDLSVLYYELNGIDQSINYCLEALELTTKNFENDQLKYGVIQNNLGRFYFYNGDYSKALSIYIASIDNVKSSIGKNSVEYYNSLKSLALLYQTTGRLTEALTLYEECSEGIKKIVGEDHLEYGILLSEIGSLLKSMGSFQKAQNYYEKAIENLGLNLGEKHPWYIVNLNNLAMLFDDMGQPEKSVKILQDVLRKMENIVGKEHLDYVSYLGNLGDLYRDSDQYEKALPLLTEAYEKTLKVLGNKHPDFGVRCNNLFLLYVDMSLYEEALLYALQNNTNRLNYINQVFAFSSEKNKTDFLTKLRLEFAQKESFAWNSHYKFDTIDQMLFNNGLELNGLILESTSKAFAAIESNSDTTLANQFNNWKDIRQKLADQYSIPIAKRTLNIDSLEQEANVLEGELVRLSSEFAKTRRQVKWQHVKQTLKSNELAIEFSTFPYMNGHDKTDSILYTAMLVAPNSEVPTIIPLFEQKQLDALLGQSQGKTDEQYISQLYASRGGAGMGSATDQARAAELYKLIWKPLEQYLDGAERIYFAPSGKLHQIAMHALPDEDGELMVQQYDMRYVNSTRVLVTGKEPDVSGKSFHAYGGINYDLTDNQWEQAVVQYQSDEPEEEDPLLALGFVVEKEPEYATDARGTDRGNTWNQLNGTATEVNSITNLLDKKDWNTQSYTGGLALEEAIKSNTGELAPDVLHIATHGFFFPDVEDKGEGSVYRQADDPMFRSGLIMAGGNRDWQQQTLPKGVENGVLTAYEVAQLDLRNTDLVVLSACETGLGDVQGSEGVYGLQRAFKQAGADYLIISLWKVPDAQTVELMELFYKYWQKGQSIPQAFRKAQLKMSKKYSPYEWAAFKLVR